MVTVIFASGPDDIAEGFIIIKKNVRNKLIELNQF